MTMAGNKEYRTKQRELIESFFQMKGEQHVTADDILQFLKSNDTPVSKSTVYRYLDKLLELGKVRKYTIEEGIGSCYQYVEENHTCKEHYHLKCLQCGKLYHISCSLMNDISEHVFRKHDFIIDSSKTVFYGVCGECREKR